jgi:hypothetical protein
VHDIPATTIVKNISEKNSGAFARRAFISIEKRSNTTGNSCKGFTK